MDLSERIELIKEALGTGGPDAPEDAYEAVKAKVLEAKLSPEETLAMAEQMAEQGSAMDRAIFREWMRVQAAAEQAHRFKSAPAIQAVVTAEGS